MGIFDWLLNHGDEEEELTGEGPPLIPSKAAAGPDAGHTKTQTAKDLRRVQGQYGADSDSFDQHRSH